MSRVAFKITVVPLLYLISVLPFPVLYLLSSICFVLVYYVIGYRRKVVTENLRRSFPEKTDAEIRQISRRFYLHFCDVLFETIKLLTISRAVFKRRCVFDDDTIRLFESHFERNQSIVGILGHCGNWEWGAIAHQFYFERMITGVYHPLSSRNFDAFMLKLRNRYDADLVPMQKLYRRLVELKAKGLSTTIGLIADQSAPPESAYWTTFMNQDTPVFNGPEKLARRFGYPVIYVNVKKTGRGRYLLSGKLITGVPETMPDGQISEAATRLLEQNIREQPHIWLWTHRRWKHKRPVFA